MKILRIQGKNLASIAGEFEVDFTREPLRSAGIFAICGPTGSGKSTLLDAVCLALFNNTPRTTGVEGTKLQDTAQEYIQQGDRRQILRRGSSEAMAAVEFIAIDGKNYRSVWRVWRANNRTNGKLQPVEWRVYDLATHTPITTGNTEAEHKLTQLIGLNYNQFTRTVLLAQNEFARFLKARKDEKAEVLEKLTGTEIYSVISNTVYTKTAAIRSEWKELSDQISHIHLLSPTELTALHQKIQTIEEQEKELKQKHESIKNKINWFNRLKEINHLKEEALQNLQTARKRQEEALSGAAWLRQAEAVESCRPIWQKKQETSNTLQVQEKALEETSRLLADVSPKTDLAVQQVALQKESVNKYTNEYNQLKPTLSEARRLDLEIANACQTARESQESLTELQEKLLFQTRRQTERNRQLSFLKEEQGRYRQWFEQHRQQESMCLNINWIEGLLDQSEALQKQMDTHRTTLSQLHLTLTANQDRQESLQQTLSAYNRQQNAWLEERQKRRQTLDSIPLTEIRKKKETLRLLREKWMQGLTWSEQWEKNQKTLQLHQEKLRPLQQNLQFIASQIIQNQQEKIIAEAKYIALRDSWEFARLSTSENISHLRSQLKENTPCPVCGSLSHPYGEKQPFTDQIFHALEKDMKQYEAEYEHLKTEYTRLETEQKYQQEKVHALQNEIQELSKECEDISTRIKEIYSDANTDFSINIEKLKGQLHESQQEMEKLLQQESEWEQQHQALQVLQKNWDLLQQKKEEIEKEFQHTAQKTVRYTAERSKQNEIIANLQSQQNDLLEKASPLIQYTDWRSQWEKHPSEFRQELSAMAQTWLTRSKQLEENQKHQLQLTTEYEENRKNLEELRQNETAALLLQKKRSEAVRSLTEQRQRLLPDQTVEEVEQYWSDLLRKNSEKLENYLQTKERLLKTSEQLKGKAAQLHSSIEQYRKSLKDSAEQFEQWLKTYNQTTDIPLTEAALISLLDARPEEIRQERERQNLLRDQVVRASATLQEREKQWTAHQQLPDRPDLTTESLEFLQTQSESVQKESEMLLRSKTEDLASLHSQQENQKLSEHLSHALENKTELLNKWSKLDDLIGSQSGYKFKEIAQGYTLEILLSYANQQLRELAPRYQLQRIPNELALQIIDHDLYDETRSVFSLSGGESFLVSLALALGLSSFSSQNHFEENLFIDEGFGTLDAETLQIVMEALERLRSQGRQIGIISHVQELTERIPVKICLVKTGNGSSKVVLKS